MRTRGLIAADDPGAAQPDENGHHFAVETGFGTLQHCIQRALADLECIEVQEQLTQTAVADRVGEAQVERQRHDIDAERRAVFEACGDRCQGDAAAARAIPGIAFDSGHHGTHHRQVDLVVTTVQHVIGVCQHGLALGAGYRLGSDRLVRIAGQRATASFAAKAARARPNTLGFLWLVRFLPLRWRQAGIIRGLPRLAEPCFKRRNPCRQALHLRPERPDQRVLFRVAQVVEVGKLGHALV